MTIPPQAKRVFKGILFDVYQWEQKLFDGSTATFEKLRRTPCADVIATVGRKILVLSQEQPSKGSFPGLPGGRIEEGEDPLEGAERELLEETGYVPGNIKLAKEFLGDSKTYFHQYLFIAHDCRKVSDGDPDAGEKIIVKLVNFDEFLQFCRIPKFTCPLELKLMMYEALLNEDKKKELEKLIFG